MVHIIENIEPPPLSPEEAALQAVWEQFEQADLDGQEALYLEQLAARQLDAELAYEMLTGIRGASDVRHDAAARARFAELAARLRRDMPNVYRHERAYYAQDLIDDAVADRRWDALPEPLADLDDEHIDTYFAVIEMLLYHGQTHALYDAMGASWEAVSASAEIMPWGVDEFGWVLMQLVFFHYLESAERPRADDPALVEALARYGEPNLEWFEDIIRHLSAPAPSPWRAADFGDAVDAEQWESNVDALLDEFMADQHRRADVPLTRSMMARTKIKEALRQQLTAGTPAQSPRSRRRRSKRRRAPAAPTFSLLPRRQVMDQTLGSDLSLFGGHPYKIGATIDLLPAYLHYLARLSLIHPTEMDRALDELKPLSTNGLTALQNYGVDVHLLAALRAAWSDDALDALRGDPALAEARAGDPAPPPPPAVTAPPKTLAFKVTYQRQPDAWFTIELRGGQTLHDLHLAILSAADFDHDHLYAFYLSGRAWDRATEYSPSNDAYRTSRTPVHNLPLRLKQRTLYLYDYGDEHRFDVQLVARGDEPPQGVYPRVLERHGQMPSQYPEWEDEDGDEEEE
jgi:hypothetical protein